MIHSSDIDSNPTPDDQPSERADEHLAASRANLAAATGRSAETSEDPSESTRSARRRRVTDGPAWSELIKRGVSPDAHGVRTAEEWAAIDASQQEPGVEFLEDSNPAPAPEPSEAQDHFDPEG